MNLKLNIEEDAELRLYIKDLIKGQVLNIAREEFVTAAKDELLHKIRALDQYALQRMVKVSLQEYAKTMLDKELEGKSIKNLVLKPMAELKLDKIIDAKDWDKLVDELATTKIQKLLKS